MPSPVLREANLKPYVERLLTAARETIDEVPFCWVVTSAGDGGANARIVKAQPTRDGEDFWTRWFLTPRAGRKAAGALTSVGRIDCEGQNRSPRLQASGFRGEGGRTSSCGS